MKHTYAILTAALVFTSSVASAKEKNSAADNTDRNKEEQAGSHKTATDQSNTPEDIKLVTSIRQMVVKDETLSMTAKNCKIITTAGRVTLRGPVNTAEEKATVENHAVMSAGKGKVDNQLEVKASK